MASRPITTYSSIASDFFLAWKDDVVSVRDLYRDRKYRKCAVLCSELLPKAEHPVHKTFLYFHQAICYESLGHISHNYSSNKIQVLEQARDAFISASKTLPLPFLTTTDGRYNTPGPSSNCATFDVLHLYDNNSPSIYPSPSPVVVERGRARSRSTTSSTSIRSIGQASRAYIVPNFDDYSPRQTIQTAAASPRCLSEATPQEDSKSLLTPKQRRAINHKARLSRSLSSQHNLAVDLVPSPLFNRDAPGRKEADIQVHLPLSATSPLPLMTLSKPLPPTPINRPLPALPFNHKSHFMLKGKRLTVVPRRKTALATLISKFEGRLPFDSPIPGAEINDKDAECSSLAAPTPTTERFQRISPAFITKTNHDDNDNIKTTITTSPTRRPLSELKNFNHQRRHGRHSSTRTPSPQKYTATPPTGSPPHIPCPNPQALPHPTPPSTPASHPTLHPPSTPTAHLTAYTTHLSSLHTSLKSHLTTISSTITKTRTLQLAHEQERRRRFAAMHSPSPTSDGPARDARLHSFWSLRANTHADADRGVGGEKEREKKERIERLRAGGGL